MEKGPMALELGLVRRGVATAMLAAVVTALSGCGSFFVYPGSGSGTSATGGDYAYVSNSTTGSTYINGYSLTNGTLTAISGFPVSIGITPQAMVVTPNDSLLFIASTFTSSSSPGLIYSWTIGSTGGLTVNNGGKTVGGGTNLTTDSEPVSLSASPNGAYLFALDKVLGTLNEYPINSNGTLGAATASVACLVNGAVGTAEQVYVAPSGKWVVCALGAAGETVYSLNQSTGVLTFQISFVSTSSSQADYAITIDGNDFLYVARNQYLAVYSLDSSTPSTTVGSNTIGSTPRGITLDRTGAYVYVADSGTNEIYEYGISGNSSAVTLTALSGSPFSSSAFVTAIAPDNSGKYFLSLGYNATNGIQLYSLSLGTLGTTGNSAGSGTTASIPAAVPAVMALTH
jgi:6-phosphogluconolactonase (cycloisomerase 2 family)